MQVWTVSTEQLPDDPLLFPDRGSASGFWRVRLEPSARVSDRFAVEGAFEQRFRDELVECLLAAGDAADTGLRRAEVEGDRRLVRPRIHRE